MALYFWNKLAIEIFLPSFVFWLFWTFCTSVVTGVIVTHLLGLCLFTELIFFRFCYQGNSALPEYVEI